MAPPSSRTRADRAPPETLAYVFFHRPRSAVGRAEYERALLAFHGTLARSPTRGFRTSRVLRLPRLPWDPRAGSSWYVDWYLMDGFAPLDPIRAVAYRAPWVDSHRAVARLAGDGWGSIYAAPGRPPAPSPPDLTAWFSSPRGVGRAVLDRWLVEGPPTGTLWRRQLALGASPEFCLVGAGSPPTVLARASTVVRPTYLNVRGRSAGGPSHRATLRRGSRAQSNR